MRKVVVLFTNRIKDSADVIHPKIESKIFDDNATFEDAFNWANSLSNGENKHFTLYFPEDGKINSLPAI